MVDGEDQEKRSIRSAEHIAAAKGYGMCKHNPTFTRMQPLNFLRLPNVRLAPPLDLSRCPDEIGDDPTGSN